MFLARRDYLNRRILVDIFGSQIVSQYFDYICAAVIVLQSAFRMFKARKLYLQRSRSAVTLQAYCRGKLIFQKYLKVRDGANKLQSGFKMILWNYYFICLREAVTFTQVRLRRHSIQGHFKILKSTAIEVQSSTLILHGLPNILGIRMHIASVFLQKKRTAILCFQRGLRYYMLVLTI
jgi:hypothetical protein